MNRTLGQKFYQILDQQNLCTVNSQQNLPMISLNQLESKVNLFKKKKQEKQNLIEQIMNNKEINVCSPFYDRMKTHKQNCKCPYHRKKRLSLLPARHTNKSSANKINQFHRNTSYDKNDIGLNKQINKLHFQKKSLNHLKKPIPDDLNHFLHTQPTGFQPKIQTRNYSYENFLKECEYFLLKKNGFKIGKPNHIVRKGVKEIFKFINKHLDYTVEKMTEWINSVEKDKDYGEFYIDRFKEMKINYELNKQLNKNSSNSSLTNLLNRTYKLNSQKSKLTHSNSSFSRAKPSRYKNAKNQSVKSSDESKNYSQQSSEDISSEKQSDDSEISLEKMVEQLKLQPKISKKKCSNLMNMRIDSYRQFFENLQENIFNLAYKDYLLQRIDTGFLSQLLKGYSYDKSIKNIQTKLEIITKTIDFLRKYQLKKTSHISDRRNSNDIRSNSKVFIGSKRNTQNGQNFKTSNSLHNHSKKASDECSLEGSQGNLKNFEEDYKAIEEDQSEIDDDGSNGQHKKMRSFNNGQNIRRSKLLKGEDFDLNFARSSNRSNAESTDFDFEMQVNRRETSKGFFTRAEKYLFDISMGKAIVNKQDSIFTAKRKVRVMKMVLKENPRCPQADELQKYIKTIEQKVYQKTKINKKNLTKSTSNLNMSDQQIWKIISLDNLGYNLIFYNLSSKINVDDNEDLCILLNEIKINGIKRFENNVTYKKHLIARQDVEQLNANHKNPISQDIFIQEEMRNMQFEPKIQPNIEKEANNETQRTTKTKKKRLNLGELKKITQIVNLNGYNAIDFNLDNLDDNQIESHYQQIKKMLKYAKVNLPETFQKYLKNSSFYSLSQINSFLEH